MIRILIGLTATAFLSFGFWLSAFSVDETIVPGLCVRVGALLIVICLNFHDLMVWRNKIPAVLVIGFLACLIIIATRPNIGRVFITLVTISIALSGTLKWLSKINNPPPKRPPPKRPPPKRPPRPN
ncbi:hypothetical protein N9043_01495 [bacterium]|nr:hypothetical protein [Mariniblastus sp.]MDB4461605.1 hypothetical protein [bacterium]